MDIANRYRDNHGSSSSDDDDDSENSDTECAVWKRAKKPATDNNEHFQNNGMHEEPSILPNEEMEEIAQPQQVSEELKPKSGEKRKRNTIWSDVLQDQLISEDLEDCLLKKPRNYGSRGKESYDYTLKYGDSQRDSDREMSDGSLNGNSGVDYSTKSKKMKSSFPVRNSSKKFLQMDISELEAARKINKVIQEKKYYLIQRVVKYAGIEKAMHYLELTKQIEDEGGMMTKNQGRRRTPGGVYLQMLKSDKDITQEVLDKIFEGEMSGFELKKHLAERKKKIKEDKRFSKHFKGNFNKKMFFEPMEMQPMDDEDNVKEEPEVLNPDTDVMQPVDDEENMNEKPEVLNPDTDVMQPVNEGENMNEKPEVLNPDTNVVSVPVIDNKSPEIVSDLEDGEIQE